MEAKDGHGRALTTTPIAAGWYRLAQRRSHPLLDPRPALRRALEVDAIFALAAVDLRALTGDATPARLAGPLTGWERHHCEIVAAAVRGEAARAAALLRLHLTEVGCDPLAVRIAGDGALRADVPPCHAATDPRLQVLPALEADIDRRRRGHTVGAGNPHAEADRDGP